MEVIKNHWEKGAQLIIENLSNINPNLPTIIFLRHSAREEPDDFEETLRAPLTDEGRMIAQKFGQNLPLDYKYRFFSSPVERCKETSDLIQETLRKRDCIVESGAILPNLTLIKNKRKPMIEYFTRDGHDFVNRWIAGFYPESIVEPPLIVAQRIAEDVLMNLDFSTKKRIDFYVSHDFHLLVILFYWTGVLATKEWIDYLGGFILQLKENNMIFYFNHTKKEIPYPFWLKQMISLQM